MESSTIPSLMDIILGKAAIPQSVLGQSELLALAEHALGLVKPRLRYLSGFVPLFEYANKERRGENLVTDISQIPRSPTPQRVFRLANLRGEWPEGEYLYEQTLLIDQSGELFVWRIFFKSEYWPSGMLKIHKATRCELRTVELSDLDLTSESDILSLHLEDRDGIQAASFNQRLGVAIVYGARHLLRKTIKERAVYLNEMEKCVEDMERCLSHIGADSSKARS
jgi:hypothetical protein